ncbi:MAG: zinc ABC transporter substrate-binding protein [Sulfurovaceae bacterium]|nr:zinc ABC transporter substrate-binding protein [Sulfurovaceae bacterium]
MNIRYFVLLAILSNFLFASIDVVTSIAPQKSLVDSIGGKNVNCTYMIPAGASPHSYEPKPSQMIAISKAKAYFTVGVEFEEAWMGRFRSQNRQMIIIDTAKGIKKIKMAAHHDGDEHDHAHHENELDPHVWTSPANLIIMATNIKNALIKLDPKNSTQYGANYTKLVASIKQTDLQIRSILKNTPKGSKFMVYHPSWGYFASYYGLVQMPVELEGKEPKPRDLVNLIKVAQKEHIKAIFVAPEFSSKSATQISNTLHIPVVKISNLGYNWHSYMISFAKAIAQYK